MVSVRSETLSRVCTGYFILKTGQVFYAIPLSDFLSDSIFSVQLNAASVKID